MSLKICVGHTKNGTPIYLTHKELSLHTQIIGASGKGRSKAVEHIIREMILQDQGLCLIDPHGYLYHDIIKWCETKQFLSKAHERHNKKIILFDPSESKWTFGFNPLPSDMENLMADVEEMVQAIAKAWGMENTDETPLLDSSLVNVLYPLAQQGYSLLEGQHLVNATDSTVRKYLVSNWGTRHIHAKSYVSVLYA